MKTFRKDGVFSAFAFVLLELLFVFDQRNQLLNPFRRKLVFLYSANVATVAVKYSRSMAAFAASVIKHVLTTC